MHLIIIAVVIVSVIGLIAGLGLAVASKVMAVPVDEKAEEIQAALPGANCGACGFSGCSGYAAALSLRARPPTPDAACPAARRSVKLLQK